MGMFGRFRQVFATKPKEAEKRRVEKPVQVARIVNKSDEKLDQISGKIDELLEIKKLYEDMLDWMVELAKNSRAQTRREPSGTSRDASVDSSILSPRLRQMLDLVKERGEILADDAVTSTGLSMNRCSEILNTLYRANYVEKHRIGREVYYRFNQTPSAKFTQEAAP